MSRTPWWFAWLIGFIIISMPSTVVWAAHSITDALHQISTELAPTTTTTVTP